MNVCQYCMCVDDQITFRKEVDFTYSCRQYIWSMMQYEYIAGLLIQHDARGLLLCGRDEQRVTMMR